MDKPIKAKKCRNKSCSCTFVPVRPLQTCCSIPCAMVIGRENALKQAAKKAQVERKTHREDVLKAKSRWQWLKEAQAAFNAYIRKRDEGLPCISCGSFTGKKNAGHYRSVGSAPELRFEESQVWLQCEKCNSYLSGNLINYRINLIKRIGLDKVEWIEEKHEPKKYTIPEIKSIKAQYKLKLKEL